MDTPLCGTHLTGNQIKNFLLHSLYFDPHGHSIAAIDAAPLGDQGYTSTVMRVKLTWSDSGQDGKHLPKSLVVKVMGSEKLETLFDPSIRDRMEQMRNDIKVGHNTECAVYSLGELRDHVPMARCYAKIKDEGETIGIIVLEDLGDRATLMPLTRVYGDSVNVEQLDNLLDIVTSLHAWSVNTSVDWKSKIATIFENPAGASFMDNVSMSLPQSMKDYPGLFEGVNMERLQAYLKSETCQERYGGDPVKRYSMPVVLVHGDLHGLNMLFEKTPTGEAGNRLAALLDWQLAHQGCGAEDVARMLAWVISAEIRRRTGADKIIENYVQVSDFFTAANSVSAAVFSSSTRRRRIKDII